MRQPSAVLVSTGVCIPPYAVSNDELVESFNQYVHWFNQMHAKEIESGRIEPLRESSSSFIEKASGIKNRYFFEKDGILDIQRMAPRIAERPNESLSLQAEKGVKASEDALKNAGLLPSDIDMVVLACSNMQRPYPAVSIEIQNALGIESAFAYDMNVACSSALFGLFNAYTAILSGAINTALIVNVEICSAHLNFRDRDSHFIFGDVATAFIIRREDLVSELQGFRILDCSLFTRFSNNIRNNFGFLNRADEAHRDDPDKLFIQQGKKVFREVSPQVIEHLSKQLDKLHLTPRDIKRFWLHQANLTMDELILKKLLGKDVSQADMPIILDQFANTSSAGSIMALHQYHQDLERGDLGLLCSFGAGYSIGSAILEKR